MLWFVFLKTGHFLDLFRSQLHKQFHWYDQRAVMSRRWQEQAADGCRQAWQGQEQEPLTLSCERICKMELQPQELELAKH